MRVEMIYSWVNATAIREEMNQFSSINRFLISANKEYQSLLTMKNKLQIVNGMTNLMRCLVLNTKCSSGSRKQN